MLAYTRIFAAIQFLVLEYMLAYASISEHKLAYCKAYASTNAIAIHANASARGYLCSVCTVHISGLLPSCVHVTKDLFRCQG
jgi:hypothetical protein